MVTNGQIDLRQLEQIAPNRYVSPGCASAWRGFSAAMGGLTVGTAADSCYRDLAWQQYRWTHQPPVAARPGTSNHGLGQAIDIGNYYRFPHSTLVRVGKQYEFVFDTKSELWHIKYTGDPRYNPLRAGSGGTAIPGTSPIFYGQDFDMLVLYIIDNMGAIWGTKTDKARYFRWTPGTVANPGTWREVSLAHAGLLAGFLAGGKPSVNCSYRQFYEYALDSHAVDPIELAKYKTAFDKYPA